MNASTSSSTEPRRQTVRDSRRTCPLDDVALLPVVARRHAELTLDRADLLGRGLSARNQREDVAIDLSELAAKRLETHACVVCHPPRLHRSACDDDLRHQVRGDANRLEADLLE